MDPITRYFSLLYFFKYELFDTYTTYIASVRTYDETPKQKYVLVYVMNGDAGSNKAQLINLRWFMLETTEDLDVKKNIPLSNFYKSHHDDDVDKRKIFQIHSRNYNQSVYSNIMGWPLKATLIHEEIKKSQYQYSDALSLHQLLNTYKCVLRRTDY